MEAYSLLEPDACANMGKEGEVETTVYGEGTLTERPSTERPSDIWTTTVRPLYFWSTVTERPQ